MTQLQSTEDKSSYPEIIKTCEKNDLFPFSLDTNNPNQFKQFDVIENCPDHHFFDEGKGLSISQVRNCSSLALHNIKIILENIFHYYLVILFFLRYVFTIKKSTHVTCIQDTQLQAILSLIY